MVVGGNEAAAWKAELLSAAGATVEVRERDPCAEIEALAADPPGGPVLLQQASMVASELRRRRGGRCRCRRRGRSQAHLLTALRRRRAGQRDRQAGLLHLPVWRRRQSLATGGRHLDQRGGTHIRSGHPLAHRGATPAGFSRWAAAAKDWRPSWSGSVLRSGGAAALLGAVCRPGTGGARPAAGRRGSRSTACRRRRGPAASGIGHVTLVGAGPGNPELLTLRALRALRSADVILFDDLVAPEILDFARREAKRMLVGKTGYGPSCKQDDINALMVGLAKSGKRVVRLKAGDPMIFGRAGEEDRGARSRRHSGRRRARHHRRARRRCQPEGIADAAQQRAAGAARHRPRAWRPTSRRPRSGSAGRPTGNNCRLHAAWHDRRTRNEVADCRRTTQSSMLCGIQRNAVR